jgi:hypothetical protein
VDPVDLEGRGPEVRAGRDRVAPANPVDRVGPANPVDRADRVDRADTNRVDRVDTNRAVRGIMADTGPADLASLADPADRVDLEDRGSPVDLDTNRAVRGLRDRVRVAQDLGQNRALLARTAPSRAHLRRAVLSRAHLRRNLPDPDLTRARPRRMPVHLHLHLTQARLHQIPARLRAPTHPGVAIADTDGVIPHDREFIWHSSGFGYCTQLCI